MQRYFTIQMICQREIGRFFTDFEFHHTSLWNVCGNNAGMLLCKYPHCMLKVYQMERNNEGEIQNASIIPTAAGP